MRPPLGKAEGVCLRHRFPIRINYPGAFCLLAQAGGLKVSAPLGRSSELTIRTSSLAAISTDPEFN
ncbi:MAG: hypothetical protein OXC38_05340 [Gammaproteobacteria bacterium]|nr:hypothetical protein [Gammaproteobacteria bacterium]